MKDIGNGPEATSSHATRAGVTTVHSPKHEVALVWIQLQQQHHSLTTQLVNLEKTTQQLLNHAFTSQHQCAVKLYILKHKPVIGTTNMGYAMTKSPHEVSYILNHSKHGSNILKRLIQKGKLALSELNSLALTSCSISEHHCGVPVSWYVNLYCITLTSGSLTVQPDQTNRSL